MVLPADEGVTVTRRHYDPLDVVSATEFGLDRPTHHWPRPATPTVEVDRRTEDGMCPRCGAERLANYRVLSEGGWWFVTKCQACLTTTRRERGELLGPFQPLAAAIHRKDA